MSQDELLPEELNDCQRVLVSLVPRASRVDRDRLMIRLGEQSAARGSTPWKWATGASLLLALVLGLRPALVPPGAAPAQLASESHSDAPRSIHSQASLPTDPEVSVPPVAVRPIDSEVDWPLALASGRFDSSRTLTVRPQLATAAQASRGGDAPVLDDSLDAIPPRRTPTLRWGDRLLRRDRVDLTAPPTS